MNRTWAIVERELRRFRRSPILIVISMVFPLVQLVILGYAMGGNVKHLKVAVVDQDGGAAGRAGARAGAARWPAARTRSTRFSTATRAPRSAICGTAASTVS